jgi:predicted nucleic acid-binding protein
VRYLVDTNILLRLNKPDDRDYRIVRAAVDSLWEAANDLCYTSQNLSEFWNVCTRPYNRNGFGLESHLTLLPDSGQVHDEWRRLIVLNCVSGVQVHDARLVAAMIVHGISHLVTFNAEDFRRYSGIVPVHPSQITGP